MVRKTRQRKKIMSDSDDSISEPEQIEKNNPKSSEKTPEPSSDAEADKNEDSEQPGCSKESEEKGSSENAENVTNEMETSGNEEPVEPTEESKEDKEEEGAPDSGNKVDSEPEDKPESSKQDEEKISEVEEAGISSTSDNVENSQEMNEDPVKSPETDKEDSSSKSGNPILRLIPIEKLLKPDIVMKQVNQDDKISTTTKSQIVSKPSVSNRNFVNTNNKNKRNSAPIVISDSSDDSSDDEPQLIDDSSDEKVSTDDEVIVKRMSSRRNKQKKSVNSDNGTNSPDKIDLSNFTSPRRILRERGTIKELSVNLSKMPNNVNKLMKVYKVNDENGTEVLSSQTSAELEMDDIESMISTTKIEKTKSKPETQLPEPDSQIVEDVTSTTDAKRGRKTEKSKPVVEKPPSKPTKAPKQKKAKEEPKKKEPAQPTRRSGRSNRPVAIFDLSSESSSPDDSSDDEASSSTVPLKSKVIKNSQSNNVDREPIKPLKITRQMLQSPNKKTSNHGQSSSGAEKNNEPEETPVPEEKEKEKENEESPKQSNLKITIKLNKNSSPSKVESNLEKEEVTPEKSKKLTHTKKSPRKERKDSVVEMVISSSDESEKDTQKSRSPRKRKTDSIEVIQPRTTRNSKKKSEEMEEEKEVGVEKEEEESGSKSGSDDDINEEFVVEGPRSRTKINPLFKDLKEKFEAKKKKRSNSLDESDDKSKGCKDSVDISTSDRKNDDSDEENEKKSLSTKANKSSKASSKSTTEKATESERKTRGRSKPIKDADETDNVIYSNENVSNENDEVEGNGNAANEIDPLNDGDEEEPIRRKEKKVKKKRVISSSESESEKNPSKKRKMNSSSDENEQNESSSSSSSSSSSDESGKSKKGAKKVVDESDEEDFQPKKSKRKKPPSDSDDSDDEDDMLDKDRPKVKRKRIKKMASSDEDGDKNDKDKSKGRKNIRKLIKKLDVSTKEAAKSERERKQRIEERQKLYNQVYDEKPEAVKELTSLVLDFDEKTKKPLLEVDKKLVKQLKPHQANGIKFMWDACFESLARCKKEAGSGCILAHCMGLGKTLQVITLVHTLLMNSEKSKVSKVLVVCPLSTVLNWVNEFDIWLRNIDRSDEIYIYEISKLKQNVDRANRLMEWHNDGGVMIMGYDMFRNLTGESIKIRKKVRESLNYTLLDPGPDLIICDEGHLLKNEKTSISKSMNRIQSLRRIVLTGTPLQNNLKEYYCMVQFVKPNLLGKYQEYMNRFVNPITNGQYTDSTQYDIQLMKRRSHVLHKMLDGCVQRRDYGVLTPFLPPKHEYILSIKLTPMQIKLYKYYMENKSRSHDEGVAKRASVLFQDFQNLQRIWTAPRVLRYNSDKYELEQQKRRDMESDEESIGSIKDFLDDEDSASSTSSGSSSGTESDDEGSVQSINSDEPLKKSKKKKKESASASAQTTGRRTRATAGNIDEELETLELESRKENPTEWWMQICPENELDNLEHSSKLVLLMAILEQCEAIGDKLLVFSQSLYSLDVIEHFLNLIDEKTQQEHKIGDENETETDGNKDKAKFTGSWSLGLDYFRLDGSTSVEQRNASCKSFNHPENHRARLFLISTRAGGLGINLVAANRVIIFDASWNPSHDIQSIFRVYRFGQTKPCYIYRFLALGTMEEKIYERQVTKQAISKRVIDEQQIDRHYNQNDLQELYRYDLEPDEERILPLLPKDRLFAELLKRYDNLIYKYHEHDTLLENKEEETLNEEERKMAWEEYEQEKNRPQYVPYVPQTTRGIGPVTSNNIFGIRTDVLLKLLSMKARMDNPTINEFQVKQVIPLLMQELYRQMGNGDMTLYSQLIALSSNLEVPTNYGGSIGLSNGGGSSLSLGAGNSGISNTKFSAQPSTSMSNYYKQQHLQRKIAEQQSRFNQMKRPPPTINGPVIEIDD